MKMGETIYVATRAEWRMWLEQNHNSKTEIWFIFYKTYTAVPRISYDDAVEEALCFGWIDSLVQTVDSEKYAQKFTPRKVKSKWSALNIRRVKRLIAEGKMTDAGLRVIPEPLLAGNNELEERPVEQYAMPTDLEMALKAQSPAWDNFTKFTEKYQQLCLRWLNTAKREETRAKRINELVSLTAQNQKIGLK